MQVILPRARLDLRGSRDAFVEEVASEYPEFRSPLQHMLEKLLVVDDEVSTFLGRCRPLPARGIVSRVRAHSHLNRMAHLNTPVASHDFLRQIPEQHPLHEILFSPLYFLSYLYAPEPTSFQAVRMLAHLVFGAGVLPDSCGGYEGHFRTTLATLRVPIVSGEELQSVESLRPGYGVLTKSGARFKAQALVSNTRLPWSTYLSKPAFAPDNPEAQPPAVGGLLVLQVTVDEGAVPKGLAPAALLLNGRRTPRPESAQDAPLLLLRCTAQAPADAGVKKRRGMQVLSVSCPVLGMEQFSQREATSRLEHAMYQRLRRLVPFLGDFVVDRQLVGPSTNGEANPNLRHPFFALGKRPILGVSLRAVQTRHRNILHAGKDVLPGLGVEGDYITGLEIADQLSKLERKMWF